MRKNMIKLTLGVKENSNWCLLLYKNLVPLYSTNGTA